MANSTIPYSFVPGTKAKASEVNANFLALANSVDDVKEFTQTQISNLETSLTEDITDITDSLVKTDLSNTNFLTNCILEAPNGVADYLNTQITIQEGLKVLISDGRNSNGTLKTVEYTVSADINYTPTMTSETRELFLSSDGTVSSYNYLAVFITTIQPATAITDCAWFNPITNIWKTTSNTGNTWTEAKIINIGRFSTDTSTITEMTTENPINFIKQSDKQQIINWAMPDYDSMYAITMNTLTQSPTDGIIIAMGGRNAMNVEVCNIFVGPDSENLTQITNTRIGAGANDRFTVTVPIAKGYWYKVEGDGSTLPKFIPLKGVTNA